MSSDILPAQNDRRRPTNDDLLTRIAELEAQVQRLSISSCFCCLTRNGLDEAIRELDLSGLSLVYFDIDGLKQANERWGKPESGRRIGEAIDMRERDVTIGQWFSGDEFAAFVPLTDALGYARRVQSRLRERNLSATFVITPLVAGDSVGAVAVAADATITFMKASGQRGSIVMQPHL